MLACADDGLGFAKMTWSSWGISAATGRGTLYENPCQPDCAESKDVYYPVLVRLSQVKTSSSGPYFSELTVTWEGKRPPNPTPSRFGLVGPA